MRLHRVQIRNFRNFRSLDVRLGEHAVIVGENRVGKSNFLMALKLVLDPSLPDTGRMLRPDDFCDSLRPLTREHRIEIAVEFADFMHNKAHFALLCDALIDPDAGIARLSYVFQPKADLTGEPTRQADYEYRLFRGTTEENEVSPVVPRHLPLNVLPALRDAEGALANWRSSPLRPLVDDLAAQIDRADLVAVAQQLESLSDSLGQHERVRQLADAISGRLHQMVGPSQAMDMRLGFSPTDPDFLLRSLRLFIDGRKRPIGEASLGSANLLYLTLRQLELDRLVQSHTRDHTFFAIEEPEAHLHPHLQRLVYREYLQPRVHLGATGASAGEVTPPVATPAPGAPATMAGAPNSGGEDLAALPVAHHSSVTKILTTHSPHIVSVSPVRSLVLLRRRPEDGSTIAVSTATLNLTDREERDLERYLDVTRGELVFARGVLLVEGEAEAYLLPAVGRMLGHDFDQLGISVCSVAGTNFEPYVKLLGPAGLDIPHAVVTDNDPQDDGTSLGRAVARRLYPFCRRASDAPEECPEEQSPEFIATVAKRGIYLNDHTLEIDLYRGGQHGPMLQVIQELTTNGAAKRRATDWGLEPLTMEPALLLKDISDIGKGRFAQCLASCLDRKGCPPYIQQAIEDVVARCR